jgi:hypothetical protein
MVLDQPEQADLHSQRRRQGHLRATNLNLARSHVVHQPFGPLYRLDRVPRRKRRGAAPPSLLQSAKSIGKLFQAETSFLLKYAYSINAVSQNSMSSEKPSPFTLAT